MGDRGIPDYVRRFIGEQITSMDQLEVLLLLRRTAPKEWTADAVARELRVDISVAAARLADLQVRGLLVIAVTHGGAPAYRYEPSSLDLDRAAAGLATAYAERRVTVIDLIFSKPIDHIRVFSDAFRLRRDDDDE